MTEFLEGFSVGLVRGAGSSLREARERRQAQEQAFIQAMSRIDPALSRQLAQVPQFVQAFQRVTGRPFSPIPMSPEEQRQEESRQRIMQRLAELQRPMTTPEGLEEPRAPTEEDILNIALEEAIRVGDVSRVAQIASTAAFRKEQLEQRRREAEARTLSEQRRLEERKEAQALREEMARTRTQVMLQNLQLARDKLEEQRQARENAQQDRAIRLMTDIVATTGKPYDEVAPAVQQFIKTGRFPPGFGSAKQSERAKAEAGRIKAEIGKVMRQINQLRGQMEVRVVNSRDPALLESFVGILNDAVDELNLLNAQHRELTGTDAVSEENLKRFEVVEREGTPVLQRIPLLRRLGTLPTPVIRRERATPETAPPEPAAPAPPTPPTPTPRRRTVEEIMRGVP